MTSLTNAEVRARVAQAIEIGDPTQIRQAMEAVKEFQRVHGRDYYLAELAEPLSLMLDTLPTLAGEPSIVALR